MIPLGILGTLSGGAAAGAYELISTTLITSDTASVTFDTSALSTYKHLQIRTTARKNTAAKGLITVKLNSDSGSNYSRHGLYGNGSVVNSNATTSSGIMLVGSIAGSDQASGVFATSVVDILDFGSSSKNTTVRSLEGYVGSSYEIMLRSNAWYNTAAVTSVLISSLADSFVSGSRFSLYGIK